MSQRAQTSRLADAGWCLEGLGLDVWPTPSIYGAGEGAEYFGVEKVLFSYHPNGELALQKLAGFRAVVCDITKWKCNPCTYSGAQLFHDHRPDTVLEEATTVARLSEKFTNLVGGFYDCGAITPFDAELTAGNCSRARKALHAKRSDLEVWASLSPPQLEQVGSEITSCVDVVNFNLPATTEAAALDREVLRCREQFHDKRLILGCGLWDYPRKQALPMEVLKHQWGQLLEYLGKGVVDGYLILAAYMIDAAQPQARWVRDFIAAN